MRKSDREAMLHCACTRIFLALMLDKLGSGQAVPQLLRQTEDRQLERVAVPAICPDTCSQGTHAQVRCFTQTCARSLLSV